MATPPPLPVVYFLVHPNHPFGESLRTNLAENPLFREGPGTVTWFIGTCLADFADAPPCDILGAFVVPQGNEKSVPFTELFLSEKVQSQCKWVHSFKAGVDDLLIPQLQQHPTIILTRNQGVYTRPLAEFVMFSCLYFARSIPFALTNQHKHVWAKFSTETLDRKTLCVVGLGNIGRVCAQLAIANGMRIVGVSIDGASQPGVAEEMYDFNGISQAIQQADYVVSILPSTPLTQQLFNAALFAQFKPNAIFINIGRGETVDENALKAVLNEGRIKGAALDAFQHEPLPETSEFWDMPNVLVSPHSAYITGACWDDVVDKFETLMNQYIAEGTVTTARVDLAKGF